MVLVRDGSGVNTDSACQPTSGSWYSPYDGVTVTASSSVDIDHMVPLAHAWRVSHPLHPSLPLETLTSNPSS